MAKKHLLKIKSIVQETADCVSIGFDIPFHLSDDFDYDPGQYLTIELEVEGAQERRAYSLSSSNLVDDELRITVKHLEGGKVSPYLVRESKVGMSVAVFTPEGSFVPALDEKSEKHYLFVAAGSGITPIISIIKSVLSFETKSQVTLLYGNQNEKSIIFKEALDNLENSYSKRFEVLHTLSSALSEWKGLKGRISKGLIEKTIDSKGLSNKDAHFYLCGPADLIAFSEQTILSRDFAKETIRKEHFFKEKVEEMTPTSEFKEASMKLVLDNEEHTILLDAETTILDAAIDAGLDAPYSCKIGACCTCRAKLLEGQVFMDDDDILTEEEIAEGFILTCQAKALTQKLIVSYDEG